MHSFIILGDDIYTLDTIAERALAAEHMRDAGVERAPVYRGGPGTCDDAVDDGANCNEEPEGRDFCSDGTFRTDEPDVTHGSPIGDMERFRNRHED